ncbi:MAG: hypothetical protein H0Z39_02270 [Peptococcaceae bacterium]|nr:hypothetical protein [Peptococcaceae bacterium]
MEKRCILCGRKFISDDMCCEDDDDLFVVPDKKKKSTDVCVMCQAKLKREADENQKNPKPM